MLKVSTINIFLIIPPCQVQDLLQIGQSEHTHWRYAIYAVRCLRTLVQRDIPLKAEHVSYFLEKVHDDHPSVVSLSLFRDTSG